MPANHTHKHAHADIDTYIHAHIHSHTHVGIDNIIYIPHKQNKIMIDVCIYKQYLRFFNYVWNQFIFFFSFERTPCLFLNSERHKSAGDKIR